jgi:hypothetical protein
MIKGSQIKLINIMFLSFKYIIKYLTLGLSLVQGFPLPLVAVSKEFFGRSDIVHNFLKLKGRLPESRCSL